MNNGTLDQEVSEPTDKSIRYTVRSSGKIKIIDKGFTIQDILEVRASEKLPWYHKEDNDMSKNFGVTPQVMTELRESPEYEQAADQYLENNPDTDIDLGVKEEKKPRGPSRNSPFSIRNLDEAFKEKIGDVFKGRTGIITSILNEDGNSEFNSDTLSVNITVKIDPLQELKPEDMTRKELQEYLKEKDDAIRQKEAEIAELKAQQEF